MMTVNQAIDCVRSYWGDTCPVGQKQAADALMNEVVWLRLQFTAIRNVVNDGVDLPAQTSNRELDTRDNRCLFTS